MTDDELEALWGRAPAAPRPARLSAALLAKALHTAGARPSTRLLERARFDVELLFDGVAVDVWEYQRQCEALDGLEGER